jgi:hypothetical protein
MAGDQSAALTIDCEACPERRGKDHCDECIVAFLLDRPPGAIVFDVAEERALRALRDGGLLPGVRLDESSRDAQVLAR